MSAKIKALTDRIKVRLTPKFLILKAVEITVFILILRFCCNELNNIFIIARINHSNADDFWMSEAVHNEWVRSHSLWSSIKTAYLHAVHMYKTWDGNFLSMFFTSLAPTAFSEYYYWVTAYVACIPTFIGAFLVSYGLLFKKFQMPFFCSMSIGTLFALVAFNFIPSTGEAIYWWSGVTNYTLFFGLGLICQAFIIFFQNKKKTVWIVLATILAFCVGLGNPLTALVNLCIIFFELAADIYKRRKVKSLLWIVFCASLIGLCISIFSPGNTLRLVSSEKPNLFLTIIESFKLSKILVPVVTKGAVYLYYWIVFAISIYSFIVSDSKFSFWFPIPMCVLAICMYSAAVAPMVYSQCDMYGRLLSILFLVLLSANFFVIIYATGYVIGFIKRKWPELIGNYVKYGFAAAFLIFSIVASSWMKSPTYRWQSMAFLAEMMYENNGYRVFEDELNARYAQLYDPDVRVPEFSKIYATIFYFDDEASIGFMIDYYDKDNINLIYKE